MGPAIFIISNIFFLAIFFAVVQNSSLWKPANFFKSLFVFILAIAYVVINKQWIFSVGGYRTSAFEQSAVFISVIFIMSPALWVTLHYFCSLIIKKTKICKNYKIKHKDFLCFRDDLSKVPPGLVTFALKLDVESYDELAASILKLKLDGFIKEKQRALYCTDKLQDNLIESEKYLLSAVESKTFKVKQYKDLVRQDAINQGLVKKNGSNKFLKLLKIIGCGVIPLLCILAIAAMSYATTLYLNVHYPLNIIDKIEYFAISEETYNGIIAQDNYKSYALEIENKYFVQTGIEGISVMDSYNNLIESMQIFVCILCLLFVFAAISSVSKISYELQHFNKKYRRTKKGIALANEAFGLKNFVKGTSQARKRIGQKITLWEYYPVYAVALGINNETEDSLVDKFITVIRPKMK